MVSVSALGAVVALSVAIFLILKKSTTRLRHDCWGTNRRFNRWCGFGGNG